MKYIKSEKKIPLHEEELQYSPLDSALKIILKDPIIYL